MSCAAMIAAATLAAAAAAAPQHDEGLRLVAVPFVSVSQPVRIFVSIVNETGDDFLYFRHGRPHYAVYVADRFRLGVREEFPENQKNPFQDVWYDVVDEQGKEPLMICNIHGSLLDARDFVPLPLGQSIGALVAFEDCYRLKPGQTYRLTVHLRHTADNPRRLPKGAFTGELVAPPITVTMPPARSTSASGSQ